LETEPELLNDAIFGAIYYRLLLRSGSLNRRFGDELVEQVMRERRSGHSRSSSTPQILIRGAHRRRGNVNPELLGVKTQPDPVMS
jgi:hypothetical protein